MLRSKHRFLSKIRVLQMVGTGPLLSGLNFWTKCTVLILLV
ncbi:MAG: hypothetical protein RIR97_1340, partial [Pseudomonadota bacterium]